MWIFYSFAHESSASTFLFANREDMEKAKQLEIAYASGLITSDDYEKRFPNVLYLIVNANYDQGGVMLVTEKNFARNGARLLLSGIEDKLAGMSIEVCFGLNCSYVPDDGQVSGEVLFRVDFSADGTVSEVPGELRYRLPELHLKPGDTALEAFRVLEGYVFAHST